MGSLVAVYHGTDMIFFFFFFFPIMLSGLRSLGVCLFNPIECIIIYPDYYA